MSLGAFGIDVNRQSGPRPVNVALVLIAVVLGGLRVAGVTHEAFQAAAHLFVGGLFAAGYVQYGFTWTEGGNDAVFKVCLGIALSLLELTVAIWQRIAQ